LPDEDLAVFSSTYRNLLLGFTDEELDFIINYDIKYRMGHDSEADI
jgi:hypothetical protein